MTTHETTTRQHRLRTFMRYVWGDQVAAHRAMLPPYDDYLINRRSAR